MQANAIKKLSVKNTMFLSISIISQHYQPWISPIPSRKTTSCPERPSNARGNSGRIRGGGGDPPWQGGGTRQGEPSPEGRDRESQEEGRQGRIWQMRAQVKEGKDGEPKAEAFHKMVSRVSYSLRIDRVDLGAVCLSLCLKCTRPDLPFSGCTYLT